MVRSRLGILNTCVCVFVGITGLAPSVGLSALPPKHEAARRQDAEKRLGGLRAAAPEVVQVEVLTSNVTEKETRYKLVEYVDLEVKILTVQRTSRKLKPGQKIRICYERRFRNMPGPTEYAPPILKTGQQVTAFLRKAWFSFKPAADFMSFEPLETDGAGRGPVLVAPLP